MANRKWKLLPDTVEDGIVYYHIETQATSNQSTKKVLDNTSNSSSAGNNVQVYAWGDGDRLRWRLSSAGSGNYDIKPHSNSNLCLDINGGTMSAGTNIRVYTCNASDAQRWKFSTS